MTASEMATLRPGDMIRNQATGSCYVVSTNHGDHITAHQTIELTDPEGWEPRFTTLKQQTIRTSQAA